MDDSNEELENAITDLTAVLEEFRGELQSTRPEQSLFNPTPETFLRITDQIAIPLLIGVLKANIQLLESLQQIIRLTRKERSIRTKASDTRTETQAQFTSMRSAVLKQLDWTLNELQRVVESSPERTESSGTDELLSEARELRDEIEQHLQTLTSVEDSDTDVSSSHYNELREPVDEPTTIDIDAELDTLREQYGTEDIDATNGGKNDSNENPDEGEDDEDDTTDRPGQ